MQLMLIFYNPLDNHIAIATVCDFALDFLLERDYELVGSFSEDIEDGK